MWPDHCVHTLQRSGRIVKAVTSVRSQCDNRLCMQCVEVGEWSAQTVGTRLRKKGWGAVLKGGYRVGKGNPEVQCPQIFQ